MALVVEDGTGRSDALSYASVAVADAYHEARGNERWVGSDTVKEQALVRATAFLDAYYQSRFSGYPLRGRAQALQWPRQGAYSQTPTGVLSVPSPLAADEVPREMIYAACEAALREVSSPGSLAPDLSTDPEVTQETVGPISVHYGSRLRTHAVHATIEHVLLTLLLPVSTSGRAERM